MASDLPKTKQVGETSQNKLWKDIVKIFYSISGYQISRIAFGIPILVISIVSFAFAFVIYYQSWLITDKSIEKIDREQHLGLGLTSNLSFYTIINNMNFWFGYMLLAFPLGLYLLVFWAYTTMLFNARLAEIVRVLNKEMISELFEINREEIEKIFLNICDRVNSHVDLH